MVTSFSKYRTLIKENLSYDVTYEGDVSDTDQDKEKEALSKWKIEGFTKNPITVTSIDGFIDDENCDLGIDLSNGEHLTFDSFYSIGPVDPKYKKDRVTLEIKKLNKDLNIESEAFLDILGNWSHFSITVLQLYKMEFIKDWCEKRGYSEQDAMDFYKGTLKP